ncbi:GNAT family N-acetyltransferase [Chryseobacterium sp.]|uniref:GNAT family N-acetyltransferase n=1 Tax=Chryseobacterium sp. TaxID=1871047 RepID=UPI00388F4C6D
MNSNSEVNFRKAIDNDYDAIWTIIEQSIERRRKDGSTQWQNGYPNRDSIQEDLEKEYGYVITVDKVVAVYGALIKNDEPAYEKIIGEWLSSGDYIVVHRVAILENFAGQGLAKIFFDYIEEFAKSQSIYSIKVDTNFDNSAMLKILDGRGYQYCGEVHVSGGFRKAFEKILV